MAFGDKLLYIAKRIKINTNEYGIQISEYAEPIKYTFSYMPSSGQTDYQLYGEAIRDMFISYLPMCFLGKINVGDKAYLIDGETQNITELVKMDKLDLQRSNANYHIKVVQPQNMRLKVIFEREKKGGRSNGS